MTPDPLAAAFADWLAARVAAEHRPAMTACATNLVEARQAGHTWIAADSAWIPALSDPGCAGLVASRDGRCWFPALAAAEAALAERIAGLASRPPRLVYSDQRRLIDRRLSDPHQHQAALLTCSRQLALITGGPGRGKTTSLVPALAAFLLPNVLTTRPPRLRLAAPTGKAARRLRDAVLNGLAALAETGVPPAVLSDLRVAAEGATTVHRLLGYRPDEDRFARNAAQPIAADLVVVDEATMLDLPIGLALTAALGPDRGLVLVGDADQLPGGGCGALFADLVTAATAGPLAGHCAVLHRDFRTQSASRNLRALAEAVRQGDAAQAIDLLRQGTHGVAWLGSAGDPLAEVATQQLLDTWLKRLLAANNPGEALAALDQARVLCALRDGPSGVSGWNRRLAKDAQAIAVTSGQTFLGRPILVTANDPALDLANGDTGVSNAEDAWFASASGPRRIASSRLPAHSDAWALTIHKSQGSEYPTVLVALPDLPHPLVSRPLLYTALTRASSLAALRASPKAIVAAIGRSGRRQTTLAERLAGGPG